MDDAEYLFNQTARERKQAGRGDFCKIRRGGRFVRLPSDHMTAKQRKELNGKMTTYDFSKPLSWNEFKQWPKEHQAAYIRRIDEKYRVSNEQIGEMFGVSRETISILRKQCGANAIKGQHKHPDMAAWEDFCKGEVPKEPEPENAPETITEAAQEAPEPIRGGADLNNIAVLLRTFAGTGAKITIELTL